MEELKRIQPPSDYPTHPHQPRKGKFNWQDTVLWVLLGLFLIGLTVLVTLVVLGVIKPQKWLQSLKKPAKTSSSLEIKAENASDYWAIFLTNNQVYFGKFGNQDKDFVSLKEVFYLRAQRQLQPDESSELTKQQIQLIKLGSELHGPVDEIQFNRDNVLFIERLKKDSRVVQGIEQYKKEGTGTLEQ